MKLFTLILIVLTLSVSGCRPTVRESLYGIEFFGLVESPVDHPALLSSVKIAQQVLGPAAETKIVAGWQATQGASGIRVFAAAPKGLADRDLMISYSECRCVVARIGGITRWLEVNTGTGEALLTVNSENLVAYMLLHEVGHMVSGDFPGTTQRSDETGQSNRHGLNLTPTAQKDREMTADSFAAKVISAAIAERGTERGVAAAAVALTLSQLSWNLAEHRLLDHFGGTPAQQTSLFWDAGLSHPNLEWRILSVNDAISNSVVSHRLLADFSSPRRSEPSVLYRARKP